MKTFDEILEETKDVFALLCVKDKEALYRYAREVPENGIIVDIGTAGGGSAFIMALASKPSVTILTIDPSVNENFLYWRTKLELDRKIIYDQITSAEAFRKFDTSRTIDMLFIDGVHDYNGVKNDFETWGSVVKLGGIIAFHDVLLYDNTIGLYVKEIHEEGKVEHLETVIDTYREDPRNIGLFVGKKL